MIKINVDVDKDYSGKQVKEMIEIALQNERDVVEANNIINRVYSLSDIYNNKKVLKTKNMIAIDHRLEAFVPAINLIGFEAVNKIVISKHKVEEEDEMPKVKIDE